MIKKWSSSVLLKLTKIFIIFYFMAWYPKVVPCHPKKLVCFIVLCYSFRRTYQEISNLSLLFVKDKKFEFFQPRQYSECGDGVVGNSAEIMTLSRVESSWQETFLHTTRVPLAPRPPHVCPWWEYFLTKAGLQADILRLGEHLLVTLRKEENDGGKVCLLKEVRSA